MSKRLMVGSSCWFIHPDGHVVEGTYCAGRKVHEIRSFRRTRGGFEEEYVEHDVPRGITVHPGVRPKEPWKDATT